MVRKGFALAGFLGLIGLSQLGCGPGYSEESAMIRCDQERTANASGCITDAAYQQCVSCYEECGGDCVRGDTCPGTYTCAGDDGAASSGSAGGSK